MPIPVLFPLCELLFQRRTILTCPSTLFVPGFSVLYGKLFQTSFEDPYAYTSGLQVFVFLGSGVNQFFALRYPGVHIVSLVAELIAFPLGVALARLLPISRFNPDRHFNIKEHALITIMSNVSFGFGSADATNIIQAAKYYGFTLQTGFSVMVVLCCQLLGYGVAGLSSRWLVEPASMIWPGVLSNIALLSSMHSKANAVADGWRISRINFFLVVGSIAFVWYWFPGLMFTGLSYFTWICWIAPKNVVVNQVFGMVTGMGLFPLSMY